MKSSISNASQTYKSAFGNNDAPAMIQTPYAEGDEVFLFEDAFDLPKARRFHSIV